MKNITVLNEHQTLAKLLEGASIARIGDGEFKLAAGHDLKQQDCDPALRKRLLEILKCEDPRYMVAIPRIADKSPKREYWERFMLAVDVHLRDDYTYASALITRPDNCPWIDNAAYYADVEKLWAGKHIAYVWGGTRKSFLPTMFESATKVDVVQSLPQQAWKDSQNVLKALRALDPKPQVVFLALGPTATALVPDIAKMGMQALDIGHLGGYMRRFTASVTKNYEPKDFVWPAGAEKYGRRYIYRTRDLEHAISSCRKRRDCIQAGGHVGVWPKHLSKFFGRVITFEAELQNFRALNLNVPEENVYRYHAALGDNHRPVSIKIHPDNIGGHHVNGFGDTPQLRIDDMHLEEVDLIVLDIEGSELAAIHGAENTINRSGPVLHLEMRGHIEKYKRGTTTELKELLARLGYKLSKEVNNDSVYVRP